jgi:hypothetical protein
MARPDLFTNLPDLSPPDPSTVGRHRRGIDELEAENARLRAQVAVLLPHAGYGVHVRIRESVKSKGDAHGSEALAQAWADAKAMRRRIDAGEFGEVDQ